MAIDIIYMVRGRGEFPIDMLRYDRSSPYSENDSNAISRTEEREVTLIHLNATRDWKPGGPRWASFCWTLITHR